MKLALCNEVIREMTFPEQCAFAAAVGYDGLELAPFTLDSEPHDLSTEERRAIRSEANAAGLEIVSLHWLLVAPTGLSITHEDPAVRTRTVDVMRRLVDLCAELGGSVLVHGSPLQRKLEADAEAEGRKRALECFAAAAEAAEAAGVSYCVEALSTRETNFINNLAEVDEILTEVDSPALRTMIDCSASAASEAESLPALLDRWLPTGKIVHLQANDPNRRGPGEGELAFAPILAALRRHGYDRAIAVEPFIYEPSGAACAARAAGYLRGLMEGQP